MTPEQYITDNEDLNNDKPTINEAIIIANQPQRLRLVFSKKEIIKYIGHLDLMLAWERSLRRARLPLAYSKGFNARPKIQTAFSLPLGTIGTAEILDIILTEPVDLATAKEQISQALPVGIGIHAIEEVPLKAPHLENLLRQAEYLVTVETELSAEVLNERISSLLAATEIWQIRERKQKSENINLRPWLHELTLTNWTPGEAQLSMRLTAGQFGNLRPIDVLQALNLHENWYGIERRQLIFEAEASQSL